MRLAANIVIAPARANSLAVASPIPEEAPVTMVTLPEIAGRGFDLMSLLTFVFDVSALWHHSFA